MNWIETLFQVNQVNKVWFTYNTPNFLSKTRVIPSFNCQERIWDAFCELNFGLYHAVKFDIVETNFLLMFSIYYSSFLLYIYQSLYTAQILPSLFLSNGFTLK